MDKRKPALSLGQEEAFVALSKAFAAAKKAGIEASLLASGVVFAFPSPAQVRAMNAFRKAVKLAEKVKLELRISGETPFVVDLIGANATPIVIQF